MWFSDDQLSQLGFHTSDYEYSQSATCALADPKLRLSPTVKQVMVSTSPSPPADRVAYYSKPTDVLEVALTWAGQPYFVALQLQQ